MPREKEQGRCGYSTRRRALVCGFLLFVLPPVLRAELGWLEPTCDARLRLTTQGDMHTRETSEMEVIVNFNAVLGPERAITISSLRLRDPKSGQTIPLKIAQDPELRYRSGNPLLRLRWDGGQLERFGEKKWDLYFHTVKPGDQRAWKTIKKTFSARYPSRVLLATSFEEADPKRPNLPKDIAPAGRDIKGHKTERVWTDETARTGKRCLTIKRTIEPDAENNTNKPFWWTWPPSIEVKEGGIYQFEIWIKTVKLRTNDHATVSMTYCDENRRRMHGAGYMKVRGPQRVSDWSCVHGSLAAPKGARYVVIAISLSYEHEVFIDDLTVRQVPGSELPGLKVAAGAVQNREDIVKSAAETATSGKKLFKVGLAKQPPKLDGVLDDACWKDAGRITDFITHLKPMAVEIERPTTVLASADRDALYLAFECMEPTAAKDPIIAKGTGRDGNIWHDDIVEIFLDTNLDQQSYYQVAFNSRGTLFDQDFGLPGLPGESWNGPIEAAAKVGKDRWTAEVRIGFVGLRLAEASGRMWTGNFCRTSMRAGDRTLYTWVKIKRNFGEPKLFGRILLPMDPTVNAVTARPLLEDRVFFGKGALPIQVKNQRAKPVRARLSVTDVGKKQPRLAGQATLLLKPRAGVEVGVPCSFPKVETTRLRFELHELPGEKLLYVTSGEYSVSEPLDLGLASSLLYVSEGVLAGTWKVGLAREAIPKSKVVLSVISGDEPTTVGVKLTPKRNDGSFVLDMGKLSTGRYTLRGELYLGKQKIAQKEIGIERISGPFSRRE